MSTPIGLTPDAYRRLMANPNLDPPQLRCPACGQPIVDGESHDDSEDAPLRYPPSTV